MYNYVNVGDSYYKNNSYDTVCHLVQTSYRATCPYHDCLYSINLVYIEATRIMVSFGACKYPSRRKHWCLAELLSGLQLRDYMYVRHAMSWSSLHWMNRLCLVRLEHPEEFYPRLLWIDITDILKAYFPVRWQSHDYTVKYNDAFF